MVRSKKAMTGIALITAVTLSCFAALSFMQVGEASPNPIVIVDPTEVIIPYCKIRSVAICVENFTGLYGIECKIAWLKDVANYTGYEWKPWPPGWTGPVFPVGPGVGENATHQWVQFGLTTAPPSKPSNYTGRWPFINVYLHCIKLEATSPLVFDRDFTQLLDRNGVPIEIEKIIDGLIINVPPPPPLYRYKAKFEYGYERVIVGAATYPSQRVPVETFTRTHVNVFNPNEVNVTVYKYFVKVYGENRSLTHRFDGRTDKAHSIVVPPNKGFEIDAEDILSWPEDPQNPIEWLFGEEFWKGYVIVECYDYELNVVAVYNKESVDIVNKITFHIEPMLTIDTPLGTFNLNEPYELSVHIPFEPENMTLADVVLTALNISEHWKKEKVLMADIILTTSYFDFLECVTKERIMFELRAGDEYWHKWLNETWLERPPEWEWPRWFRPCTTLEKIVKVKGYPTMSPEEWEIFHSLGDVNLDGYIDETDAEIIADNFGWTGPLGGNPADINSDGKVDAFDAVICATNQGKDIWTHFGIPIIKELEEIRVPVDIVRENIYKELIASGVPPHIALVIVNALRIEVLDVDVAEGVGTSIDVEYIEPEIIIDP